LNRSTIHVDGTVQEGDSYRTRWTGLEGIGLKVHYLYPTSAVRKNLIDGLQHPQLEKIQICVELIDFMDSDSILLYKFVLN
jgi:hypothetical protein